MAVWVCGCVQNYQCWCDLRKLESAVGERYLTEEDDDDHWETYRRDMQLPAWQDHGHRGTTIITYSLCHVVFSCLSESWSCRTLPTANTYWLLYYGQGEGVRLMRPGFTFLADRTYGRAIGTVLRLSSSSSVTLCIVAKRCVLEQKLLLRAYRKSYIRNRLVPKWMTSTFV